MIKSANIKTYKLKHELDNIPKQYGGLYFFTLRLPSDYELGITDDNIEIARIINLLKIKLDHFSSLCPIQFLFCDLLDLKAKHLRTNYKIDSQSVLKPSIILDELAPHLSTAIYLKSLIDMLRFTISFSPPIYIGIASQQSLYERICQHLNGETPLEKLLKQFNIDWNDIELRCHVNNAQMSEIELRLWEKLLHNIFKPRLSKR